MGKPSERLIPSHGASNTLPTIPTPPVPAKPKSGDRALTIAPPGRDGPRSRFLAVSALTWSCRRASRPPNCLHANVEELGYLGKTAAVFVAHTAHLKALRGR